MRSPTSYHCRHLPYDHFDIVVVVAVVSQSVTLISTPFARKNNDLKSKFKQNYCTIVMTSMMVVRVLARLCPPHIVGFSIEKRGKGKRRVLENILYLQIWWKIKLLSNSQLGLLRTPTSTKVEMRNFRMHKSPLWSLRARQQSRIHSYRNARVLSRFDLDWQSIQFHSIQFSTWHVNTASKKTKSPNNYFVCRMKAQWVNSFVSVL